MVERFLGPEEFWQRFSGRHFGKRRAVVKDVNDPQQMGRVRVYCPTLYGGSLSPWVSADADLGGGMDSGSVRVPPLNAEVMIECEDGQPSAPTYSGGTWSPSPGVERKSDGSPLEADPGYKADSNPTPKHSRGHVDGSDFDGTLRGTDGVPKTNFQGTYPNVRTTRTPGGHVLEFDDTPGSERVLLMHKSGGFLEFLPDGSITVVSPGIIKHRSEGTTEQVEGPRHVKVKGVRSSVSDSDRTDTVGGKWDVSVTNKSTWTMGGIDRTVDGDLVETVKGAMKVEAHGYLSMLSAGDLSFAGMAHLLFTSGGYGRMVFSYTGNVDPTKDALHIAARTGRIRLEATDTTAAQKYGIEIQPNPLPAPAVPVIGVTGPHVRIGNITPDAASDGTASTQEPVVLGIQLLAMMNSLQTALTKMAGLLATGGTTPGFGGPNPILATAMAGLSADLGAHLASHLTPASAKLTVPMLSQTVYVSEK